MFSPVFICKRFTPFRLDGKNVQINPFQHPVKTYHTVSWGIRRNKEQTLNSGQKKTLLLRKDCCHLRPNPSYKLLVDGFNSTSLINLGLTDTSHNPLVGDGGNKVGVGLGTSVLLWLHHAVGILKRKGGLHRVSDTRMKYGRKRCKKPIEA